MARDGMLSALFLDCGWKEKKIGDASLFSQVLGAINCHSADVRSGLDDLLLHKEGGKGWEMPCSLNTWCCGLCTGPGLAPVWCRDSTPSLKTQLTSTAAQEFFNQEEKKYERRSVSWSLMRHASSLFRPFFQPAFVL